MKLKMNKYKQGAGSDSRLEQDYHKVKTCPDMLNVCFNSPDPQTCTYSILFAWSHCAKAIWHTLQAVKHVHMHISTSYCLCALMSAQCLLTDSHTNRPEQVNTQISSKIGVH